MFTQDARTDTLTVVGRVQLPAHTSGGFDHGDVHLASGRVFVAHTANGTLEVIDGKNLRPEQTVPGCPEGSGVVCAHGTTDLVFAASRGDGSVLVIDPTSCAVLNRISVGPKPNGLAWDVDGGHLLVADVETYDARLIDPLTGTCLRIRQLPGRPRWCVYDAPRQRFLVNVREPACLVALAREDLHEVARIVDLPAGPHGLDVDRSRNHAFVASDAAQVAVIHLGADREIARIPIAGEPDAIWYSATTDRLYIAIGDPGMIQVLDGKTLSLVDELMTEKGAHTTALDSQRHRLYVFLPMSCQVLVCAENSLVA